MQISEYALLENFHIHSGRQIFNKFYIISYTEQYTNENILIGVMTL